MRTLPWFGIYDRWQKKCKTTIPARCSVVALAEANGSFETLIKALGAAGLKDTLNGEGPFTVFAPTDAAFDALPAGTLDTLLQDPTGVLKDILLLHVVSGEVGSADLSTGTVTTLGGDVNVDADALTINNAQINGDLVDLDACNGVVHVMNSVILPS